MLGRASRRAQDIAPASRPDDAGADSRRGPLGAATVLAGIVLAGALALWLLPPGSKRESRLCLRAPFPVTDYVGSHGATVELPRWWRWSPENPPALTVYEDGKKLGAAMVKEAVASPEDAGRR